VIELISGVLPGENPLLEQAFRLRHSIFVDERGWEVLRRAPAGSFYNRAGGRTAFRRNKGGAGHRLYHRSRTDRHDLCRGCGTNPDKQASVWVVARFLSGERAAFFAGNSRAALSASGWFTNLVFRSSKSNATGQ
jgi:hypothetical protein